MSRGVASKKRIRKKIMKKNLKWLRSVKTGDDDSMIIGEYAKFCQKFFSCARFRALAEEFRMTPTDLNKRLFS